MTYQEAEHIILNSIADRISVKHQGDYKDHNGQDCWELKLRFEIEEEIVRVIFTKLKSEGAIFDYKIANDQELDYETLTTLDTYFVKAFLTDAQIEVFIKPKFNRGTGRLTYKGISVDFGIEDKQFKLLYLLSSDPSKMFSYKDMYFAVYDKADKSSAVNKKNIQDLVDAIMDKLKKHGIEYQLFNSNGGYQINL